jgi:lysophospholipase L1-like esterase
MTARRHRTLLLLTTVATAAAVCLSGAAHAAAPRPTAIVAMGDSIASGEAAGAYESGTDRAGNFCHRSARAEIQVAPIAAERRFNLACSGATTANVGLTGPGQYGEAPQAQRLRAIARDNQVRLIAVTVGANDVGFGNMVLDCIRAFFLLGPRCQSIWAPKVTAGLASSAPRIAAVLADVRTVMRDAGYADSDYRLVLESYSSPVTEDNRYAHTQAFEGCPLRNDDAKWARDSVVGQFTSTMAQVAATAGAGYLDRGPALRGREVCARGITHAQEWAKGIQIDATEIRNGLGPNLVQQSLHPNAAGHAQFGRCLAAYWASGGPAARCVRQPDGNLTAVPVARAVLAADTAPRTVPPMPQPALVTDRATAYRLERAGR